MSYFNPDIRREFYRQQHERTGGQCEICGLKDRLVVDHDHHTGKCRGLLCYRHNTGMGMFEDNPNLLERAATYLRAAGTTGGNWVPKRKRRHHNLPLTQLTKAIARDAHMSRRREVALRLLAQDGFASDRARAKVLAVEVGLKYETAQTFISRLRHECALKVLPDSNP